MEALPGRQSVSEWISTRDQMPIVGNRILGHIAPKATPVMSESDGCPDVFLWTGSRWVNQNSSNCLRDDWTVIYWMPCPAAPRDPSEVNEVQP